MLALFREISLRHWVRSPLRSLLVMLGIALAVALYVATQTAANSMLASFHEFVARVSGRADLTIEGGGVGVPGELLSDVADVPGVAHSASTVEVSAQAPEYGESILVLGVDFLGDPHFLPFSVQEGDHRVIEDPLAFVNDPTAILVARRFATRHSLTKGSRLRLLTSDGPKDFSVKGVLEDSGAAASFGGQLAVMFLDAAQVSFARGTFVDRIDVSVDKGANLETVRDALLKLAGPSRTVERPDRMGVRLRALAAPLEGALGLSAFLALLVGGFLVYNAVGVAVAQRTREIGTLRALGVTRRRTVQLFCIEAMLLAAPGIGLGLVLGQSLARYSTETTMKALSRLATAMPDVEPHLTWDVAAGGVGAGLLTAVLAAWWPARRGASVDPAIVLRGSSTVERTRLPLVPMLVGSIVLLSLAWTPFFQGSELGGGVALTATVLGAALATPALMVGLRRALVGVVEALLGLPARLGLDYVARTLGRSTVNVLALMVAVGMSVSVGGWLSSIERSIGSWVDEIGIADLTVTLGSPIIDRRHVPLSADAADKIAKVPGVDRTQSYRIIDEPALGKSFRLVATDTDVFLSEAGRRGKAWLVVDGAPLHPGELTARPRILLSENAARRLHLKAGDSLTLHTPKGDVPFEVRAVIVDYTSETGAGFIDRQFFSQYWADSAVDGVSIYLKDGVNDDKVADTVRAALGGAGSVFVTKTTTVREQLVDSLRQTFSYSRSVELVTLLIALMGVIGTMAAAVIDRAREIGMLRAIGATSRQVATSIIVEAGFLGFCAVVGGAGLGVVACKLFLRTMVATDMGWHLDFIFPWGATARIGSLVVATSALAGGLPAWRAARSNVSSAVVCE